MSVPHRKAPRITCRSWQVWPHVSDAHNLHSARCFTDALCQGRRRVSLCRRAPKLPIMFCLNHPISPPNLAWSVLCILVDPLRLPTRWLLFMLSRTMPLLRELLLTILTLFHAASQGCSLYSGQRPCVSFTLNRVVCLRLFWMCAVTFVVFPLLVRDALYQRNTFCKFAKHLKCVQRVSDIWRHGTVRQY